MSARPRLGFVGLGRMGAAMTRRLLSRGFEVTVWNLERERFAEVRDAGARWAVTPAAVRAASDVVLICVLGDDAIDNVCFGPGGLVEAEGADTVIDLSTTSVATTLSAAGRLGVGWLDCPVSGGPGPAEEGRLAIMAGGEESLFRRFEPVLAELGASVTLMGSAGAGQTTKIVNQAIVGASYLVMAEVLAIVRAAGIAGEKLPAALAGGAADSFALRHTFPVMLQRDFEPPRGRAGQLGKDLRAVAGFVEGLGLDLPVIGAAISQYLRYVDAGNGDSESASVSRLYDREDPG